MSAAGTRFDALVDVLVSPQLSVRQRTADSVVLVPPEIDPTFTLRLATLPGPQGDVLIGGVRLRGGFELAAWTEAADLRSERTHSRAPGDRQLTERTQRAWLGEWIRDLLRAAGDAAARAGRS
jgi:hypothetical protein